MVVFTEKEASTKSVTSLPNSKKANDMNSSEYRQFRDVLGKQILAGYQQYDEVLKNLSHLRGDKKQKAIEFRDLSNKQSIIDFWSSVVTSGGDIETNLKHIRALHQKELNGKANLFDNYFDEILLPMPDEVKRRGFKDPIFKKHFLESANRIINNDIQPKLADLNVNVDPAIKDRISSTAWTGVKIAAHAQAAVLTTKGAYKGFSLLRDRYTGAHGVREALNALDLSKATNIDDLIKEKSLSTALQNYSGDAVALVKKLAPEVIEAKNLSRGAKICKAIGMAPVFKNGTTTFSLGKTALKAFGTGLKFGGFAGGPIGVIGGLVAGLALELVITEGMDAVSTFMSDEAPKQEGWCPIGEWVGSYCKSVFA